VANFTLEEMQAWVESSRLSVTFDDIDDDLAKQITEQVFARLGLLYTTASWVDETTTPQLVRSILAMQYVAWKYDAAYSVDDEEGSNYAALLRQTSENNMLALLSGVITLPDIVSEVAGTIGQPSFFPNDLSTATAPSWDFPADGPEAFNMGQVF
jgi:hypothetical protein